MGILKKISKLFGLLALSLMFGLTSCETTKVDDPEEPMPEEPKDKPDKPKPPKDKPPVRDVVVDPPEIDLDPPKEEVSPPAPEENPYGIVIPGMRGMIRSPHLPAEDKRLIDVEGLKPGTKIRCPYTKKILLVP